MMHAFGQIKWHILIILGLLIMMGLKAHGAVLAPGVQQTGTRHVLVPVAPGVEPGRGGSWVDPLSKLTPRRVTDVNLMRNPQSARNNPQAHAGKISAGLYNGYSRFSDESADHKWVLGFDTDGGGFGIKLDGTTWTMLLQKDGTPIQLEYSEGRIDTSGIAEREHWIWYWGSDGKTYRCQDLDKGPKSEVVWLTVPYVHYHSGDCNASRDNRFVAYAFVLSRYASGQPIVGVTALDLVGKTLLPGYRTYDLSKKNVYMNGCSVGPDGKWLQSELDFTPLEALRAGLIDAPAKRGAINGGHGGWVWWNRESCWFWAEGATDYLQVFDPNNGANFPVLQFEEIGFKTGTHALTLLDPGTNGYGLLSTYDTNTTLSNQLIGIELKPINAALHPAYSNNSTSASKAWAAGWVPKAKWPWLKRLFYTNNNSLLNGNDAGYFAQGFVNAGQDGSTALWAGNWCQRNNLELFWCVLGDWKAELAAASAGGGVATPVPTAKPVATATPTPTATPSAEYIPYGTTKPISGPATVLYSTPTPTPTPAPQTISLPAVASNYFYAYNQTLGNTTRGNAPGDTYIYIGQFDHAQPTSNRIDAGALLAFKAPAILPGARAFLILTHHPKTEGGNLPTGRESIPVVRIMGAPFQGAYIAHPETTGEAASNGASWLYRTQAADDSGAPWTSLASTAPGKYAPRTGDLSTALEPVTASTPRLSFSTKGTTSSVEISDYVRAAAGGLLQLAIYTPAAESPDVFAIPGGTKTHTVNMGIYGCGADAAVRPRLVVSYTDSE